MNNNTVNELRKLDHKIGQTQVSHDGTMRISVDGNMLTYPEIDKLLAEHRKKEES
jgi:hypothetical protein